MVANLPSLCTLYSNKVQMVIISESTLFLVLIRVDTQDAVRRKERSLSHLSAIHVNYMRSKKKHATIKLIMQKKDYDTSEWLREAV